MCPGKGSGLYQGPVDEEVAAAAAAAAAAASAAEVARWESAARAGMRWVAALLLADVRGLGVLIARTQYSRAMLASAIDRLHEAAQELNLPLSDAGWIMAHPLGGAGGVLQGAPLPGSIAAARRTVGRLCGILPPARYLQIYECWYHLTPMANCKVYIEGDAVLVICAEILFPAPADESPQWQRWRGRMDSASAQPGVVRTRLFDARDRARIAHEHLFNLVEFWHADGVARMDRAGKLSLAEENLQLTVDLMDQALTAMRQMHDALELQAYELMILAR